MQMLPSAVDPASSVHWACYLRAVYNETPNVVVNIRNFQLVYVPQMLRCGLDVTNYYLPARSVADSTTQEGVIRFNLQRTKHRAHANHSWVEITHCTRGLVEAGYWMYALKGSGVFVNIGRTAVFRTHGDALQRVVAPLGICRSSNCIDHHVGGIDEFWKTMHPLCNQLRLQGFDSVQFEYSEGKLRPMELFLTRLSGTHTCGPVKHKVDNHLALRTGYRATVPLTCDPMKYCVCPEFKTTV
jgi:hypothetical protein